MFESIELYAQRIGHSPLLRFIEGSQRMHDLIGLKTKEVKYNEQSGVLHASLEVLPIHQGTVYNQNSIMYGMVIAALADMATGAAAYLRAGTDQVVNHSETRIKYLTIVPIEAGTRLTIQINVPSIRRRFRSYYCLGIINQERNNQVIETAHVWAKIPSMLEKVFERILTARL